jgi:SAM-dependent methyltransferase
MIEAIYLDPRLAALYDTFNAWGADTDHYLGLAGPGGRLRILDVGCGSGLLACALAQQGHAVTGLDPAPSMLDIARARPGGDRVVWIDGVLTDHDIEPPFDLAVMSGHAFQVFLTDTEILETFNALRRVMAPTGRLAFETRNPKAEAWRAWTPEASRRTVTVNGLGQVETWHALTSVEGERVAFDSFYRIGDEVLASQATLRFAGQELIDKLLRQAGFETMTWAGDWTGGPVQQDSQELIVVAS